MGKAWKKKYQVTADDALAPVKSKLDFVYKLETFLQEWRKEYLDLTTIRDRQIGMILTEEDMRDTVRRNAQMSLLQLEKLLNQRIQSRIKFLCTSTDEQFRKKKLQEYRKYFDSSVHKWTEVQIYEMFLREISFREMRIKNEDGVTESSHSIDAWETVITNIRKGKMDLYDTAALGLIWQRILKKKDEDEFSQIIIDEAQDFGEMIYYVMKQLLPGCYFTIMGDVSQNIRYETGMNDWEGLKSVLFERENDTFYLLAKSYRNTIEISQCAGKVLEKASQGSYRIRPVIRHGNEVTVIQKTGRELEEALKNTVQQTIGRGHETIAVVCRDESDAEEVRQILHMEENNDEFHNGVMVLPVTLTKGLEFDAVILWKPDERRYGGNPREAKLLYVAITRALHELYLLGDQKISGLFR